MLLYIDFSYEFLLSLQAVGLDGVVSQWSGPGTGSYRCGSRLVSGLFTRVQLPLGYTLVATLPAGACRINITELHHSNNFLGEPPHRRTEPIHSHHYDF